MFSLTSFNPYIFKSSFILILYKNSETCVLPYVILIGNLLIIVGSFNTVSIHFNNLGYSLLISERFSKCLNLLYTITLV